MAAGVHGDDLIGVGKRVHLMDEIAPILPVSVEEHQGEARSPLVVV